MSEITQTGGYLDVVDATLRAPRLEATSNIGISNTNPEHSFSVGSNLYVDTESSNVITVRGNVVTQGVKVGTIEIVPSYDLAAVSNVGNVTANTIIFTNETQGFVATGNATIGSTLTISGFRITAAAAAEDDLEAITTSTQDKPNAGDTTNAIRVRNGTDSTSFDTGALQVGTNTGANGGLGVAGNVHVAQGVYTQDLSVSGDVVSNLAVNTDDLFVDIVNSRVGIGKTEPTAALDVVGNVAVDTNTLFVDSVNNKVGIGVTEPGATLEVTGNAYVSSNLEVGTANLFVDTVNSRVGIGTTDPRSPLTIYNGEGMHITPTFTVNYDQYSILDFNYGGGTSAGTLSSIRLKCEAVNRDSGAGPSFFDYGAQGKLIFQGKTNNTYSGGASDQTYTNIMTVDGSTHRVGIGTVNPGYNLVVHNSIGSSIQMEISGSTSGETSTTLVLKDRFNHPSPRGSLILYHRGNNTQWSHGPLYNSTLFGFKYNSSTTAYDNSSSSASNLVGYLSTTGNDQNMNNFTGQHRCFIKNVPFNRANELEGLIVSSDQNKYIKMSRGIEAGSNAITMNESLPVVSLSIVVTDKKCFGVISASEDPEKRFDTYGCFGTPFDKEEGDTRVYINSVGEGAIWVVNTNGSLEAGDYITTSNVAGYGQKQDSEFLANYTVAKITMDCDFNPVTQPVQIIKKEMGDVNYWVKTTYENVSEEEYSNLTDENRRIVDGIYQKIIKEESKTEQEGYELEVRQELVNILDEHGQIQWEDDPSGATEKAYKIRYLDADGNITDEANHVYKAAFVGCTYHCG